MNQQLKTQVFNLCFPMTSPIAVPSLDLQDLTVPGVSGPAEGGRVSGNLCFSSALRLYVGVHILLTFFLK